MSYIRQGTLFSYDDFVEGEDDNTRLVLTLCALPDERLVAWLGRRRIGRRNPYPLVVLWSCLVAKFVYQIRTYAELIRELKRNGSLRRLVGIESVGRVPRDYHFSRFLKLLSSETGLEYLQEMFAGLVGSLAEVVPDFGEHLAVDSTALHAYSNEMRRQKSDVDAAWSARPKRQRRRKGNGQVEQYMDHWFGYAVHLVADCETELPVGFEVTPANVNETTRFKPMLEALKEAHPRLIAGTKAVMADRGFDSQYNCEYVLREYEALPIIKMRLTQVKDEISQAAETLCNELGTQICLSGHEMVYGGRDGDYLKWHCPVARGKAQECLMRGRCTASAYGAVRKVKIWDDPRRYPGLARESKNNQS